MIILLHLLALLAHTITAESGERFRFSRKVSTVYVVGAGPVGMTIAARYLDLLLSRGEPPNRQFEFAFIEKRSSYSRLQQLAIWKDNWEILPIAVRKKLAAKGCVRNSPFLLAPATCYLFKDQSRSETLPDGTVFAFVMQVINHADIKDLEEILREYLTDLSLWWRGNEVDPSAINFFVDGMTDDFGAHLPF
jgi:hypothetical protein